MNVEKQRKTLAFTEAANKVNSAVAELQMIADILSFEETRAYLRLRGTARIVNERTEALRCDG